VYLEQPGAKEQLSELARHPRFKGVRRLFDEEPDDAFPVRDDVIRGVERLAQHNLSFDICIRCGQLASVIELLRRVPQVKFVLDHCGKPNIRKAQWQPWADQIAEIARYENAWCKLSGLMTEAGPEKCSIEHLHPYIAHVMESFGYERVMFGTDWPVCTLANDVEIWMGIVRGALKSASEAQRARIYRESCIEFYRL
jgi:L-fuconolactonase